MNDDEYECRSAADIVYPEHDYDLFGCRRCGAEWARCEEIDP